MNINSNSTTPTLRPWHRARNKSITRPPSSSSVSSTDPSYLSTPEEVLFIPFSSQVQRPAVPAFSQECASQKSGDTSTVSGTRASEDSSLDATPLRRDQDDIIDVSYACTQSVTPATVFGARHIESPNPTMHFPFPTSNQRNSASSTESTFAYDEERVRFPTRRSLPKRGSPKSSSLQHTEAKCPTSPTKSQRGHSHTHRPESAHSTVSTQSSASCSSSSLRVKQKKTHSQRAAINIFRSLSSSPQPTPTHGFEDIEFDWAGQRREDLENRVQLLEQECAQERKAMQFQTQSDSVGIETTIPTIRELTPQESALRRELEEHNFRRFVFKEHIWVNSSYVSAHPKHTVPYPLAYDKVNLQSDHHSHDLVTQIFSGRPSIHCDITTKDPVTVLDLGCGDGSWIIEAAQSWKHTLFYGLDLQNLHPPHTQILAELGDQVAENIRFIYFNFINDKLPFLDEKFDMVRMANLKWAIPECNWDFVLEEVHRVLKRGGWVELIDEDFMLPLAPDCTLSETQLAVFDKLETQFKNMLQARKLQLNLSSSFMAEKLGCHFSAFHEEDFTVSMSKARPTPLPAEGMSYKAAKLMGIGIDESHLSFEFARPRSRAGSVGSATSYSTRDDTNVLCEALVDGDPGEPMDNVPRRLAIQPVGLDIHPGRFVPFPPTELNAHAIRNMQSILACKEAIRANELTKSPELVALEIRDELLLDEKQRLEQLSFEWEERRRAFDDAFWEYESNMMRRLCLPHRCFDIDDDGDVKTHLRPQRHRSKSQRGSEVSLSSAALSTFSLASTTTVASVASNFSFGSSLQVRCLRIYTGWK